MTPNFVPASVKMLALNDLIKSFATSKIKLNETGLSVSKINNGKPSCLPQRSLKIIFLILETNLKLKSPVEYKIT